MTAPLHLSNFIKCLIAVLCICTSSLAQDTAIDQLHYLIPNLNEAVYAIAFPAIPAKTICDPDFDPKATSNLPITYTSSEPDVADIIDGLIHIYGPGTATITASNGVETATQRISVSDIQKPYAIISTPIIDICEGATVSFRAAVDNAGKNPSFLWLVNGADVSNNSDTYTTNALKDNDRISIVVINNDYCSPISSFASNSIRVSVSPFTPFTVEISTTKSSAICAGTAITFNASTTGNTNTPPNIKWFVNGKYTNSTGDTFTSSTLNDGDVINCEANGRSACLSNTVAYSNSIDVAIRNDCEIVVPNSFSPNGDGINDAWQIKAIADTDLIKVFNRNGSILFQSKGYAKPWDGTLNGKPVPVGTYYYIVNAAGGTKKLSGSITIIR
ncbi:gliding motility-associated C-terminal domain-containing protein [Pedobacter sp. GSP4]|uniref:gliding motility-associated C-terminal domain-containing protein n=1 Tax=Pedobacter sp. GSP4 TaxID=3453716 RepID=UPI003EEA6276